MIPILFLKKASLMFSAPLLVEASYFLSISYSSTLFLMSNMNHSCCNHSERLYFALSTKDSNDFDLILEELKKLTQFTNGAKIHEQGYVACVASFFAGFFFFGVIL